MVRRGVRWIAASAVLGLLLGSTACGDDDDVVAGDSTTSSSTASSSTSPPTSSGSVTTAPGTSLPPGFPTTTLAPDETTRRDAEAEVLALFPQPPHATS